MSEYGEDCLGFEDFLRLMRTSRKHGLITCLGVRPSRGGFTAARFRTRAHALVPWLGGVYHLA